MKLQAERIVGVNAISSFVDTEVSVNGHPYRHSVVIPWQGSVQNWGPAQFKELTPDDFQRVAALQPELVIFGSGSKLRFPSPAWLKSLIQQGIGLETMDSAAACRTYNVLVSEGRRAVLALLLPAPGNFDVSL